ncbi:uncharacterized protein LOC103171684 isoform X1 [Callorhinchus milii]|uniref:uncharacterized protein LOC103171684 isoform X1 n=1 Tax=Callorhinchus milii TaxID=7868 RepID=UPI001C3F7C50|nr:uncharacterized protein LOC103171684 isoform X1 [Callorhinchus milii]
MSAEEQMERMKRHWEAQRFKPSAPGQRRSPAMGHERATLGLKDKASSKPPSGLVLSVRPVTSLSHPPSPSPGVVATDSRTKPTNGGVTVGARLPAERGGCAASPVKVSNKLVTMTPAPQRGRESEAGRTARRECKPSKMAIATHCVRQDPDSILSPGQRQEHQEALERIRAVVTKTSPSAVGEPCSPPDGEGGVRERERDRIISLSYALAAEASQRSRSMAVKAVSESEDSEEGSWPDSGGSAREESVRIPSQTRQETNRPSSGSDEARQPPSSLPDNQPETLSRESAVTQSARSRLALASPVPGFPSESGLPGGGAEHSPDQPGTAWGEGTAEAGASLEELPHLYLI